MSPAFLILMFALAVIAVWAFLSKREIDQKIDDRLARQADYEARLADYKRRQSEKIVEEVKRELPEVSDRSAKGIASILGRLAWTRIARSADRDSWDDTAFMGAAIRGLCIQPSENELTKFMAVSTRRRAARAVKGKT